MIIGEQVKAARRRNGKMTQRELADALGVSLRTVNGWENGATIPPPEQAQLAALLGIDAQIAPQVRAHIDPLTELSDAQLIAELARRLGELRTYAALHSAGLDIAPGIVTQGVGGSATATASDQMSRVGNDRRTSGEHGQAKGKMTERHPTGAEGDNDDDGVIGAGIEVQHNDDAVVGHARDTQSGRNSRAR